jgi:DNA-directed RNA polymerase
LGAEQVNLLPSDKPQDVYEAVASIIREMVDSDASNGHKIALALQGKITRKVSIVLAKGAGVGGGVYGP